jgi:hypothetical protein
MDIEGHELQALLGSRRTIERLKGQIGFIQEPGRALAQRAARWSCYIRNSSVEGRAWAERPTHRVRSQLPELVTFERLANRPSTAL